MDTHDNTMTQSDALKLGQVFWYMIQQFVTIANSAIFGHGGNNSDQHNSNTSKGSGTRVLFIRHSWGYRLLALFPILFTKPSPNPL